MVQYYDNVKNNSPANSAFVYVLLQDTGLDADDTLRDFDTLATLIAANTEATFTSYARKIVTDSDLAALPSPDDTNNRFDLDMPDWVFATAGGASNNTIQKLVVGYDADTTSGTDANIVPCLLLNVNIVTDGNQLTIAVNASGIWRSQD
jgi:hypothetical protein